MNIVVTAIGTRGDIEPFLAIGEMLVQKGHQVTGLFPAQFEAITKEAGLSFASLGPEFLEAINSEDGKKAMGGEARGIRKLIAYAKVGFKYRNMNVGMVQKQYAIIETLQPDRILHNGKVVYPVIYALHNRCKAIFVSPIPYLIHPVKHHPHIGFSGNFGPYLNQLTYRLANWCLFTAIMINVRRLGVKGIARKNIQAAYEQNTAIYTVSPAIFKRPTYWPKHVQVLGYQERQKAVHWTPSKELLTFLEKHQKIIFLTFGSMTNPTPEQKTKVFLDILEKHQIPAIINTAAGGLTIPEEYSTDLVYFTATIPYDWIFPKIHAVIHHGGSGTTHLALKYGCACMIIPHIIDQFMWNEEMYKLGVGPKGLPVSRISVDNLEEKIVDIFNKDDYREAAQVIGQQMQEEDYLEIIYKIILD